MLAVTRSRTKEAVWSITRQHSAHFTLGNDHPHYLPPLSSPGAGVCLCCQRLPIVIQVSDSGLTTITTMFLSKKVRLFIDHWDKIWQLQFSKQTDCWCCSRSADELHYILLRSTEIATRLGTEFIDCFKWVSWKPEINVNHASSIDKYDPHLRQQAPELKSAMNLKRVDNWAFWSVLHFIK